MDQRCASVSWSGRYSNSRYEERDEQEELVQQDTAKKNMGSYRWDAGPHFFPTSSLSKMMDHESMMAKSPVGNKNPIFTMKNKQTTKHWGGKHDIDLVMPQRSTSQESLLSYLCERWRA
jgi:hypothetical protein